MWLFFFAFFSSYQPLELFLLSKKIVYDKEIFVNLVKECKVSKINQRKVITNISLQSCFSVAKSYPTLCDPMNLSTPGSPVFYYLLEFAQTPVWAKSQWCYPTISSSVTPFSSCPQSLPASVFSNESTKHLSPVAQMVKCLPTMWETWVWSLGWEDLLEKEMATHSSILAWKIPWMEERGRLQSMGLQRVGHDWASFALLYKTP